MLKLQFWTSSLDEFNAQPIWHRPACFASPGTGAVDTFGVDWHETIDYRNLLRWLGDVTRLGCVKEVYY